jgi:hypothetical protein
MSRRFKYNIEAIQPSIKVECPHCHFVLGAEDILAVNSEGFRCKFCDGDFIPPDKAAYQRNQKLEGRSRPIPLRRHSGDKSPFTD